MRRMASATAVAALLAAGPAHGFDAASVDIIGLRLGMQETEIVARLKTQGYAALRTPERITAQTADGLLQVALSAEHCVTQIKYVMRSNRPQDTAAMLEAVLVRFGEPSQTMPPTWCLAVGPDGICPSGQAALTFLPHQTTLLLRREADPQP